MNVHIELSFNLRPSRRVERQRSARLFFIAWLALMTCLEVRAEAPVRFNEQIRPLINTQCAKCHGGVKEAGKLHLLFREEALKGGKSGLPAIVPGKPETSELIPRLITDNEEDRMPKDHDALAPEQIALFKRWIAEGAKWEEHWAYVPPKKNGLSIDAIVKARLTKEKLSLAPEADRRTLARRTALDVTGLPPSPEAVESFVKDRSPKAYEHWVDRLLAEPAYGERWAAVWLDIARYADSKGYEKDDFRSMWRYRDWVIDAFNDDMPYDRFLIEQLAGDLLSKPTEEQIIATAFHRNTQSNDEGGTDDEEFRTYAVIDRVNTTFDAVQGTTIGCVQCHGHPYDPIVHREYYQLLAFFNNTADADREDEKPTRKFYAKTDADNAAQLETQIAATQRKVDDGLKLAENRDAFDAWVRDIRPKENSLPLQQQAVTSTAGEYRVLDDGRIRIQGDAPLNTTLTVTGIPAAGKVNALVLEMLTDDGLPNNGPGANPEGNFILSRIRAELVPTNSETVTQLRFTNAHATYEQEGWFARKALRTGPDKTPEEDAGWAIQGGTGRPQTATFVLPTPIEVAAGTTLRVTLEFENQQWRNHVPGSFRLATRRAEISETFAALAKELRNFMERDPAAWKPEERAKAEQQFFTTHDAPLTGLYQSLVKERAALAALTACNLPIMQELTGTNARVTKIFHRGNWLDKTDVVTPVTPKILNAWHDDYPRNRLGFAKWLTSGENPLTARVQVNRVWEQLFGIGLVETLEDFGSQGDKPVYQELLDELAVRFQTDMKWSQKQLLREIILSRMYQQSSKATPAMLERDPANRLLARGPRFRLTSEQLRDQALAVSGLLNSTMSGPPVMPYQPPGMWLTPYDGRDWVTSTNGNAHRRALYTFIRRSATYPSFVSFDSPSREFCTVRRIRSNTPLQSLDLLNSPVFFEAAEGLAKRMATEGGATVESQITRALELALQRPPRRDEIAALKKLHVRVNGNLPLVANAILNLDEVINKN